MNLLRQLVSGVWMLDRRTAEAYLPYVARLLKGESVDFPKYEAVLPRAVVAYTGEDYSGNYDEKREEELLMVYSIRGMITKLDQDCGPTGTETLMRRMKKADTRDSVIGHFLEIDSGGGEATNIETTARFIRNEITKPVIAWFNGVAGSAAYYIACASHEVYASEETDEAGSIGALLTLSDFRGAFEKEGIKIHEIYADQSDLKNLDTRQARDGNYEKLRKGAVNPYAQRFIDTVKEFRPKLTAPEAYRGEIYMTPDAIRIGMIDGQKTYRQAIERLAELGRAHKQNQQSNSQTSYSNMRYKKIESALGGPIETNREGGAYLNAEDLQRIEAELSDLPAASATEDPRIAEMNKTLLSMDGKIGEMSASLDGLGEQITAMGKKPGAGRTVAPTAGDEQELISSDEKKDALLEMERIATESAGGDGVLRVQ